MTMPIDHIDRAGLERLRSAGTVTLLDVRTDAEVARGIIAGARHMPLHQLPERYTELDPEAELVIYCQSGGRSANACAWLAARGFGRVHNLAGGVLGWLRDGQPLTDPT
jgi:rhodanese-related sulfurtransferase